MDGWCNAPSHLLDTLYNDVKDYLIKHDAGKAFKSGKKFIKTHNIDINIRYCFVRGNCCPEQRISNTNHDVWVCLHKDSGKIINAGYTCVDG